MKEGIYDDLFEEKEEKTGFHTAPFKYIIRRHWSAAPVITCLAAAWLYLKYTTPVYNISASVIIRDDKKGGAAGNNFSVFKDLDIISSSSNIDNEIKILHGRSLIKDVIYELGLYISYSTTDGFGATDSYDSSSILVHSPPEGADRLTDPILLTINYHAGEQTNVTAAINEAVLNRHLTKLPMVIFGEANTLTLMPNPIIPIEGSGSIEVSITKPFILAKGHRSALSIESTSKTTSVVTISINGTHTKRGEGFTNKLVETYSRDTNDDKSEAAENTTHLIGKRISVIDQELGTTERELESFKHEAGPTDLSNDAKLAISKRSEYEKLYMESGTQLNLIQYLSNYLDEPESSYTTLPVNVGLNDNTLAGLIIQYSAPILERNRLLCTSFEANPVTQRLNNDIQNMRTNFITTIISVHRGLLITESDLDHETGKCTGRTSSAPTQEHRFVSIQRQQEIKAGLYLVLLQEREENNTILTATANNAKIIGNALAGESPISPKGKLIYLITLVLGPGIPVAIICVLNLPSFRTEGRNDTEKLTTVPIIGDVLLTESEMGNKHVTAVRENDNNIVAETFRSIRTNLLLMLGEPDQKVIPATSTISGEGKTFIVSNLTVNLILLGKRVIIVGLGIYEPGLNKVFNISHREGGIAPYLSSPKTTDSSSLIRPPGVTDHLDPLLEGAIPPNSTELLARQSLQDAIEILRQRYDYIVLDTAPIGMVTNTWFIAYVADTSVYVCHTDYTHKNDYQFTNELQNNNRLPDLCIVINELDMKGKKYGYYYGHGKYGKCYGYGKKYGYGHGYGYDSTSDHR